jgi:hypothetical protein
VNDDPNFAKQFPESAQHPRSVVAFALVVKILIRYGWIPLLGMLLIAWLLDWGHWKTLLAVGVAGLLLIAISPAVLGVVGAVVGRRRAMAANPTGNPPAQGSPPDR